MVCRFPTCSHNVPSWFQSIFYSIEFKLVCVVWYSMSSLLQHEWYFQYKLTRPTSSIPSPKQDLL